MGGHEITEELNEALQSDQPANTTTASLPGTNQPETQDSSTSLLDVDLMIGHPWTTGLFDCPQDQRNAIVTAFLPCVTFGQIAEVLDEGKSTCGCRSSCYFLLMLASYSQWILSTEYRTKQRKKFNLEEAPYTDVASHIFCPCCSLCQEFRELKSRGLDPALGWNGILAQQQGRQSDDEQLNVPPPYQAMSK
ncbi:protein PLANT CADMIUM RESISTANCE 8 isoform X2 [Hevea brasiliensis]|uniref:protein PLANT CADMIUM RESISTANCE 8 isoform X2 n=1 Tax=Hevea brasiliensis TaxID=3981 RepID=UPI000B792014|nr:protein PLANT CADMIUM RESISTANCE 8 isoform X2 [Hevea brasiliensis]